MARAQSAVVPWRTRGKQLQILLITTRTGKRWVIPKGLVERGLTHRQSAVHEAYEEAGAVGEVSKHDFGTYKYSKNGMTCRVRVFLMHVKEVLDHFPEAGLRERRWLRADEAPDWVEDPGLQEILEAVPETLRRNGTPRKAGKIG